MKLREKLAKNTYYIARQYIQLKKYKASGIYFDEVIKRYPDTIYFEQAWKGRIDVLIKRKSGLMQVRRLIGICSFSLTKAEICRRPVTGS